MPKMRLFLVSLGAGTVISLLGFGGLLLGIWLDATLDVTPCLTLVLVLLGLGAGIFAAYRLLMWGFSQQ